MSSFRPTVWDSFKPCEAEGVGTSSTLQTVESGGAQISNLDVQWQGTTFASDDLGWEHVTN